MKILLLGVGMQGKVALHDLLTYAPTTEILAADKDIAALRAHVAQAGYGSSVTCVQMDADHPDSLDHVFARQPDLAINLLPNHFGDAVVSRAVEYGCHMVDTSYASPLMSRLAAQAEHKQIALLPEFGLDPGLDLVLLGQARHQFDDISVVRSYGAGLPEPAAIDNPLSYKITWTFEGVLHSYRRPGILIENGQVKEIRGTDIFNPEHMHEVLIESLGRLEAYPNGDASSYLAPMGLQAGDMALMGRYTLRWPGHCAFWKSLADLHFLDEEPVSIEGQAIDRLAYLAALLSPHLQLEADQRDLALVRVEVEGQKNGKPAQHSWQVLAYRDLQTGFTAMSRTVGCTASIGAQLIADGTIQKRGLLSPLNNIPYARLVEELRKREIQIDAA